MDPKPINHTLLKICFWPINFKINSLFKYPRLLSIFQIIWKSKLKMKTSLPWNNYFKKIKILKTRFKKIKL